MRAPLPDFKHAVRSAVRQPGLTLSTTLTLGVVLAAATVVFAMVDAVLLLPLPFREPDRLVTVWGRPDDPGGPLLELSPIDAVPWRQHSRTLSGLALTTTVPYDLTATCAGRPVRARYLSAFSGFFGVLGIEAALGRTFEPARDGRPGTRVVLLTHEFWRRCGADRGIVGRSIDLDGDPFEVIGVLPRSVPFPRATDVWVPQEFFIVDPTQRIFEGVARLRPGATPADAQAELTRISARAGRLVPARVTPLADEILGDSRAALNLMAGAVGLLLLIACANTAGLLLARAVARQREMALRSALGAGPGRLIRQLLTENLLLAALAAAFAVPLAGAGLHLLSVHAPADIPRLATSALDARALAFLATASLLSVALFGFVPAFEAVSPDLAGALREGERSSAGVRSARMRLLLVAGQAALALVLLLLAGLTVRSFIALRRVDLGFAPAGRLAFRLELPDDWSEAEHVAGFRALLRRLERVPGVDTASAVLMRPLTGSVGWDYTAVPEGQSPGGQTAGTVVNFERVSPGTFRTLGIPLVRGRDFTWDDTAAAPLVAIVSRTAAERLWPGRNPLGKRLRWSDAPGRWLTVVGVAGDVRYREIAGVRPDVYVPFPQNGFRAMDLVLRTAATPRQLAGPVARAVRSVVPGLPETPEPVPLEHSVAAAVARPRLRALVLLAFAALAALLAAVGVYGSVAYAVAQRRREMAIRLALGAGRGALVRLALGPVLAAAGLGIAAGLLAFTVHLTRPGTTALLASLLYGVGPADPATLLAAPLLLLAVALLGALLPLRRALQTDAAAALRAE
jgi:predicted permease